MKAFTILLLVGAVICGVASEDAESENDKDSALQNILEASSKNNGDDNIENLCEDEDDMTECAKEFFKKHAKCNVVQESGNKTVHKKRHYAYTPILNTTYILTDVTITNLQGKIKNFHMNKNSGNLVMSVGFDGIKIDTKLVHIFISRVGKEPLLVSDNAYGTYPVILTATIPAKNEITSSLSNKYFVSGYLPEKYVNFYFGPNVSDSKNPVVQEMFNGFSEHIPTILQELFLTAAPDFFLAYLEQEICDFGIALEHAYNL